MNDDPAGRSESGHSEFGHSEEVLYGLDEAQRSCVVHPPTPLVIEAGPGSGKTQVLTARVAYRALTSTADPARTMVVTFTRHAAGELRDRLDLFGVQGVQVGTFHAIARALLENYWADSGQSPRRITDNPRRLISLAIDQLHSQRGDVYLSPDELLREIEWAVPRGIRPSAYLESAEAASREARSSLDLVAAGYEGYDRLKRSRRVMDVDDLLVDLVTALEDDSFAAAVRWRFRHLFVDEAQDLNRLQVSVLRSLLGDGDDLCIVGDPDQAIYGWNGGDADLLVAFETYFPGAHRIRLTGNYRCAWAVVDAAARVIDALNPVQDGVGLAPRVRSVTEDRPGSVVVRSYEDEEDEAKAVAWAISEAHAEGIGWSQLAVLGRTRKVLEATEAALSIRGIPVRTGRRLLDDPLVKAALTQLDTGLPSQPARSCAVDLRQIVDQILVEVDLEDSQVARHELSGRLGQLVDLVDEWARDVPGGRLEYLRDWLASTVRSRGGDPGEPQVGVELSTFHRAKGLEWRRVFIVGLEQGLVPLSHAEDADEERRLLYVALTRAEESVVCTWAKNRRTGSGRRDELRDPSPWLDLLAIDPHPSSGDTPLVGVDLERGRRMINDLRETLGRSA